MPSLNQSLKQGSVYCLRDPLTNKVRYVGMTSKKLNTRLSEHVSDAVYGRGANSEKDQWINSLLENGTAPKIDLLWVGAGLELLKAEQYFIKEYSKNGFNLVNVMHNLTQKKYKARKKITHCHKGHPLNEENIKVYITKTGYPLRKCVACYNDRLSSNRQLKAS